MSEPTVASPAEQNPPVPTAPTAFPAHLASPWWLLLLAPLFFTGLSMPLQTPDEPREAEIARAMFEGWELPVTLNDPVEARRNGWTLPPDLPPGASPAGRHVEGSYVVPHLAGRPFLEKPPLYYWSVCASFAVFGVNATAARLPNALYGLLVCLLVYALVRHWSNGVYALCAAVMLATMHRYWEFAHRIMIDMVLVACVTAGYYAYARWQEAFFLGGTPKSPEPSAEAPPPPGNWRDAAGWSVAFWAAIGLAFLAKNAAGPVLILSGCGIHLLFACWQTRRWVGSFLALNIGLPALALLVAPWLWQLYRALGQPALRELLIDNNFGRFMAGYAGHGNANPLFYVDNFFTLGAPWTLLTSAALLWLLPALSRSSAPGLAGESRPLAPERSQTVLLLCWVLIPTVVLSLSEGKRSLYLLPLLPGQAAALGLYLAYRHAPRPHWVRAFCLGLDWILSAVILLALIGALIFSLAPSLPTGGYNSMASRRYLPVLDFGAPSYGYVPWGLAAVAMAIWAFRLTRRPQAASNGLRGFPVTTWLALCAAVGLFYMGVHLGGLLDFMYQRRSLEAFDQACSRADRGELFLVFCGEKERGMLAWSSRGKHLAEEPHGKAGDPAAGIPSVPIFDVLQAKLDAPGRRFVLLPENTLRQFTQEFPTWRRHLYPTEVLAINDAWYWLLSNRADLPNPPPAAIAGRIPAWPRTADLRLLIHPTQAGWRLWLNGEDLPRIWNAVDLTAWAAAHPETPLLAPEDLLPGAEARPLDRIRAEWPLFDATFEEIGLVTLGAEWPGYNGQQPVVGPRFRVFLPRRHGLEGPTQPTQ